MSYTVKLKRNGKCIGKAEGFASQASAHTYAQKVADQHPSDKVTIENGHSIENRRKPTRKRNPAKPRAPVGKASTRYRISEGGRELVRSERLLGAARKRAARLARTTGQPVVIIKQHLKGRTVLESVAVERIGPRANKGGSKGGSIGHGPKAYIRKHAADAKAEARSEMSDRHHGDDPVSSGSSEAEELPLDTFDEDIGAIENGRRRQTGQKITRYTAQAKLEERGYIVLDGGIPSGSGWIFTVQGLGPDSPEGRIEIRGTEDASGRVSASIGRLTRNGRRRRTLRNRGSLRRW